MTFAEAWYSVSISVSPFLSHFDIVMVFGWGMPLRSCWYCRLHASLTNRSIVASYMSTESFNEATKKSIPFKVFVLQKNVCSQRSLTVKSSSIEQLRVDLERIA